MTEEYNFIVKIVGLVCLFFLLFVVSLEVFNQITEQRQFNCIVSVNGLNMVPAELEDICGSLKD